MKPHEPSPESAPIQAPEQRLSFDQIDAANEALDSRLRALEKRLGLPAPTPESETDPQAERPDLVARGIRIPQGRTGNERHFPGSDSRLTGTKEPGASNPVAETLFAPTSTKQGRQSNGGVRPYDDVLFGTARAADTEAQRETQARTDNEEAENDSAHSTTIEPGVVSDAHTETERGFTPDDQNKITGRRSLVEIMKAVKTPASIAVGAAALLGAAIFLPSTADKQPKSPAVNEAQAVVDPGQRALVGPVAPTDIPELPPAPAQPKTKTFSVTFDNESTLWGANTKLLSDAGVDASAPAVDRLNKQMLKETGANPYNLHAGSKVTITVDQNGKVISSHADLH